MPRIKQTGLRQITLDVVERGYRDLTDEIVDVTFENDAWPLEGVPAHFCVDWNRSKSPTVTFDHILLNNLQFTAEALIALGTNVTDDVRLAAQRARVLAQIRGWEDELCRKLAQAGPYDPEAA